MGCLEGLRGGEGRALVGLVMLGGSLGCIRRIYLESSTANQFWKSTIR